MRNPAKAILVSVLIAIPAPLVLGVLLTSTPDALRLLALGEPLEALGSGSGIAAYVCAVVIFAIVGVLSILVAGKQTEASGNQSRSQAPRQNRQPRNQQLEEDDLDDDSPEGNEEGTVKWFNVKKGFGFIVRDGGDEIFVHFRAIRGRGRRVLRQGQLVRFDVVEAEKGLQANNVSILSD